VRLYALFVAAAVAAVLAVAPAQAQNPRLVHVTVIGDSVPTAIGLDPTAVAILGHGIDLDLETVACRRLDYPSCTPTGASTPPLNVVQMAQAKMPLGPVVVIVCGYNDKVNLFPQEIADTLAALESDGVRRIFWLTLREAMHPYISMNDNLIAAAASHPEVTVLDWNMYSRSHPDWFAADGLHLVNPQGGEAMATFIHDRLVKAHVAPAPVTVGTRRLPVAFRAKPYHATLDGADGLQPYHWTLADSPPAGIHLLPDGVLWGRPTGPRGIYQLTVTVHDALGDSASRTLSLRIA
jgi:hypothetical protein